MKKIFNFFLFLSFLSFVYIGCCKDPDCSGAKETKAYFEGYNTGEYNIYPNYPYVETDTNWSHMTFVAKDIADATYYKWIIGREELENQPIVYREGFPRNEPIPITLIVHKKPNKECFPNDDGIDTLIKTYYFTDKDWRWYKVNAKTTYRGSFAHKPMDTFEFTIHYSDITTNKLDTLYNYPCKGDKMLMYKDNYIKYNYFHGNLAVDGQKFVCDSLKAIYFSYSKTGNSIIVRHYKYSITEQYPKEYYIFKGYPIN